MTISYNTAGTAQNAIADTFSVGYPAATTSGDLLILVVVSKYPTISVSTPSGWENAQNVEGGQGSAGVDTGLIQVDLWTRVADGTEGGTSVSVTVTGNNVSYARIFEYQSDVAGNWELAFTSGSDNAGGSTAWSITGAANPGLTVDDMLLVANGINTDGYTYSSHAVSATGVTWGVVAERQDAGTTSGQDCGMLVSEHPVNTGTASAAPVYTATASGSATSNPAGAAIFVRMRIVPDRAVSKTDGATVADLPGVAIEISENIPLDLPAQDVTVGEDVALDALLLPPISTMLDGATLGEALDLALSDMTIEDYDDILSVGEAATVEIEGLVAANTISVTDGVTVVDQPAYYSDDITVGEVLSVAAPSADARTISLTDGATVGEDDLVVVEALPVPAIDVTDNAAVTETCTIAVSDSQIDMLDALTIGDVPQAFVEEAGAQSISVSDNATVGDVPQLERAEATAWIIDATDDLTLADLPQVAPQEAGAQTIDVLDSLSVADLPQMTLSSAQVDVLDAIAVGEIAQIQHDDDRLSVTDDLTVSDLPQIQHDDDRLSVTDALTVDDPVQIQHDDDRLSVLDAITIGDVPQLIAEEAGAQSIYIIEDLFIGEPLQVERTEATPNDLSVLDGVTVADLSPSVLVNEPGGQDISIVDNVTMDDPVLVALEDATALALSVTDDAALADLVTVEIVAIPAYAIDVIDGSSVSDLPLLTIALPDLVISDDLIVGEDASVALGDKGAYVIAVLDDAGVGETLTQMLDDLQIGKLDGATVGESDLTLSLPEIGSITIVVQDDASLGEIVIANINLPGISVIDALAVGESRAQTLVSDVSETDGVSVGETLSLAEALFGVSVTDDTVVSDALDAQLPDLAVPAVDGTTLGETVSIQLDSASVSALDNLVVAEALTLVLPTMQISVLDDVVLSEVNWLSYGAIIEPLFKGMWRGERRKC